MRTMCVGLARCLQDGLTLVLRFVHDALRLDRVGYNVRLRRAAEVGHLILIAGAGP